MSSIIFIGSPEKISDKDSSVREKYQRLFLITPYKISQRIMISFLPPFGKKLQKVYIDFLGPLLAVVFLAAILNYGYSYKGNKISVAPTEFLLCYTLFMPILCYFLAKLGRSNLFLTEIISLLGYALYGHICTILLSYVCYQETSNMFFFMSMILFGGSSNFRLIVVFIKTIPIPGARLIICSLVAVIQVLFIVFLHFAYMHRTFVYGQRLR